jgi:hypothetical protein
MRQPPPPGSAEPWGPPAGPPTFDARQALNVPSILLMVFGGIAALTSLASVATPSSAGQLDALLSNPDIPPQVARVVESLAGTGGKLLNLLAAVVGGLVVFGAIQMRALKMYPAAIAAAVLSMLPFGSCCCCLSLPVGIWALVILVKPEVRSQFT